MNATQQHWTYTHVFQNSSTGTGDVAAAQAELHRELAGLGTTLADGHSVVLLVAGAVASGKTLTLVGDPDEASRKEGFFLADGGVERELSRAGSPGQERGGSVPKKVSRKDKAKEGGVDSTATRGDDVAVAKASPLAGLFPRLVAEAFATLAHRRAQCAFTVHVSAAAVSASDATAGRDGGAVECLLPPPPGNSESAPLDASAESPGSAQAVQHEGDPARPPPSPPDDALWGRAVPAASPHEVVAIVEAARLRAAGAPAGAPPSERYDRHFLSRVRVELENHSTKEASACDMVIAELAEEGVGNTWPVALAQVIRDHPAVTAAKTEKQNGAKSFQDPLLDMVRSCLGDTTKVRLSGPRGPSAPRTKLALIERGLTRVTPWLTLST